MNEEQNNRECRCCDGVMRSALVRFTVAKSDSVYVVNDVPALQCDQCGETAYDGETLSKLELLSSGRSLPRKVVNAWVYNWSDPVRPIYKDKENSSTEVTNVTWHEGTSVVRMSAQ